MDKNEYLPNSFSGNMLSAFTIQNDKQAVDEKYGVELPISTNTLRPEKVEDVNYSDYDPDQKLNLLENVSEKYKYNLVNVYGI